MKKSAIIAFFVGLGLCGQIHALPSLQLFIDPAVNPGSFYDAGSQTWVYSGNQLVLSAFALDSDLGSGQGDAFSGSSVDAILSVALPGGLATPADLGDTMPASAFGTITIDGNTVPGSSWTYGLAPIATVDTNDQSDDLAKHGVFPTWYAEYAFNFGAFGAPVFNTQPPLGAPSDAGWRRDFTVDLSGLQAQGAHFDLYTLEGSAIYAFAPFSHDAEANRGPVVPEPASMMLLGAGLIGSAAFFRSKSR